MWERSVCISQEEGMEEKKRTGETAFLTEGTASARAEGRCGVFMEPPVLEGRGGGGQPGRARLGNEQHCPPTEAFVLRGVEGNAAIKVQATGDRC